MGIVIDPEIRHGKPVIRGTRVPVELILGSLAGGMRVDEVAREYVWGGKGRRTNNPFKKALTENKLFFIDYN
ncbi:MAG: DUF433 domain-containing protein [Candidatus Methanospirareceae archaeon]